MALKALIQNKLLTTIRTAEFFARVTYDADNLATEGSLELGSAVITSLHSNEVQTSFEADPRHGRDQKQRRSTWLFELRVLFKAEVSVEAFEEWWIDNGVRLSRQDTSSKQVDLFLVNTEITHPPQQSPSTGTKAVFTVEAALSRS